MKKANSGRWFIAIRGTLLQVVLGTVYAWSFFQNPIIAEYGWSNVETMWIFSSSILFLGLSAAIGGMMLPKFGPRRLASVGALLYGLGYFVSAYAMHINSLPLFYLGFGMIGGMGLGLSYVTPVATVSKWFPDKKGFITGMVVMGFGLGALVMSKLIAPLLMRFTDGNMVEVFFYIAVDRKSTRLNSSHVRISYAVFCLKKKTDPRLPDCWSYIDDVVSTGYGYTIASKPLSDAHTIMMYITNSTTNSSKSLVLISLEHNN